MAMVCAAALAGAAGLLAPAAAGAEETPKNAAAPAAAAPATAAPAPLAGPANPLRLILPDVLPAVVGREMNLYFDNVILVPNWRNYLYDVTCNRGSQQEERWTYVPKAEDVGQFTLKLDVYDVNNQMVASASTIIRVIPADAGADKEVVFLIIGDSLTNASVYPGEMVTLCREPGNPKLKLLGTNGGSDPENRHEGYGGWTYQRFITHYAPESDAGDRLKRGSPFMFLQDGKPVYDFKRYIREKCDGKAPDFVSIALGCNDTFGAKEDNLEATVETVLGYADKMVAGIREARADTHIGLVMLVPPAASQDAFGSNYQCSQTRWQYRRNQHRVVERMKEKYNGREKERLYLVPAYVNLDTVRNYPTTEAPANARCTLKIVRQNNGVHPAGPGYLQMADSIYAWMKSLLQ